MLSFGRHTPYSCRPLPDVEACYRVPLVQPGILLFNEYSTTKPMRGNDLFFVLVNSSMNTQKKGVFGGVHPQTHLFFGNLVVHIFVDEYRKNQN